MITIFRHFLRHMLRDRGLHSQSAGFFALAMMMCVFALGSQDVLLVATLPNIAWAILLLSSMLGLPNLLEGESLDDLVLSRHDLPALMFAKAAAHWVATGLPIALFAPPLMAVIMPSINIYLYCLWIGFAVGSLAFSAAGIVGAALTIGSRRNAALQALIVMPLCVPALIFGAGAVAAAQLDLGALAPLAFLGAIACASITLAPFAAAWIVRMKVKGS